MSDAPGYLYRGRTTHVRYRPYRRGFAYGLYQLFLDVDRVGDACAAAPLLTYNRAGPFSFYDRDHGDRSGRPLRPWAEAAMAQAGVRLDGGRIWLLTFPRVFGYVFNPLSVFFGYGPGGDLRGVLYEVNNTFGETHTYVANLPGAGAHAVEKRLHVSPFFDVRGRHRFRLRPPGERFSLVIENDVEGEREHLASLVGWREPLTNMRLIAAALREPLLTFKVISAIHWEALWIWRRGARYRRKPTPPAQRLSFAVPDPAAAMTTVDER